MPELVSLDRSADGVATVTLQHGKVNALSVEVLEQLADVAEQLARPTTGTDRVRVVVVTGGPKIFAAGADISQFAPGGLPDAADGPFAVAPPERVREIGGAFLRALNAVAGLPMPTIASVAGYALGGGFELALACDLRIASDRARFGLPEILLGIIPGGGGTQRLARLAGPGVAKELVYTGRQIEAAEALRLGVVTEVVPHDELEERVTAFARRLAGGAPNALAIAKAAIDGGLQGTLAAGLELEQDRFVEVFGTADATIGVRSFLESGPGHADFGAVD